MVDEQFRALDTQQHGEVSRVQFAKNLSLFGTFKPDPHLSTLLFDAFDANRSGRLELSDFKLAIGMLVHGTYTERANRKH
jgi:Ca2+-binding EF-hand superfamily protein